MFPKDLTRIRCPHEKADDNTNAASRGWLSNGALPVFAVTTIGHMPMFGYFPNMVIY